MLLKKKFLTMVLAAACSTALLAGCGPEKEPYVPTGDGLAKDEITLPTGAVARFKVLSIARS